MKFRAVWLLANLAIVLLGCGHRAEQFILPDQVTDFSALYGGNCAGCHGRDGKRGAARPLNDPLYLALIGKDKLRDVIEKGVPRTAMPAFALNAGGTLTDQQITILADQIEARWARPQEFVRVALPPYSAGPGDQKRGGAVFGNYCSRCHGDNGKGGSVTEIKIRPSRERAQNRLLYAAPVTLAESGMWHLALTILRNGERTDAAGTIEVAPAPEMAASYWSYIALPPFMVGIFVVRKRLIRRKAKR